MELRHKLIGRKKQAVAKALLDDSVVLRILAAAMLFDPCRRD
jgi:hypothetical protein